MNSYKRTLPLLLLLLLLSFSGFSQKRDLDANRKYEIGNIEITGLKSYNAQTVLTFTGLKSGERIYVPGQRLSDIITNLWDQNLFSDISIYVTRMEGDVVDLEINIQELPTLNNVSISGIRDRKARDIINDNELKKGQKVTQNLLTTTKNYILNKYREQGFLNAQ